MSNPNPPLYNRPPTAAEREADRVGFARALTDDGAPRATPGVPCGAGATPPPVTSKQPPAELRALGLKPFAIWSCDLGRYLDIPTTWATGPAAAIRQMATTRDRGAAFVDRHDRRPSRTTRDLRVVWSDGRGDTGLLRADLQPFPEKPDVAVPEPGSMASDMLPLMRVKGTSSIAGRLVRVIDVRPGGDDDLRVTVRLETRRPNDPPNPQWTMRPRELEPEVLSLDPANYSPTCAHGPHPGPHGCTWDPAIVAYRCNGCGKLTDGDGAQVHA